MTLAEVAGEAARRLQTAGFEADEARRDVGVLARAWLGWDRARWIANTTRPASETFAAGLTAWVQRRAGREPVAYIVGRREFYGRMFRVTPAVLIPRPETELVIDAGIAALRASAAPAPRVLDVGTGSGCLAVTLALEYPAARVVATDISSDALDVAAANARRHGVGDRVSFVHTSLTAGVPGTFDLIVSNPPYVPEVDRPQLSADVRDHEPAVALFGGPDGLDVVRALLPAARHALGAGGRVLIEIGAGQDAAIAPLLAVSGLHLLAITPDLAGIPRLVIAAPDGLPV